MRRDGKFSTVCFDVMCGGRFVMQYIYRWCPLFPLDTDEVMEEILSSRPSLRGKSLELYMTDNILGRR